MWREVLLCYPEQQGAFTHAPTNPQCWHTTIRPSWFFLQSLTDDGPLFIRSRHKEQDVSFLSHIFWQSLTLHPRRPDKRDWWISFNRDHRCLHGRSRPRQNIPQGGTWSLSREKLLLPMLFFRVQFSSLMLQRVQWSSTWPDIESQLLSFAHQEIAEIKLIWHLFDLYLYLSDWHGSHYFANRTKRCSTIFDFYRTDYYICTAAAACVLTHSSPYANLFCQTLYVTVWLCIIGRWKSRNFLSLFIRGIVGIFHGNLSSFHTEYRFRSPSDIRDHP